VSDSDGEFTQPGGETWLAFHESGAAFLVVATDDDGLSYEGTFSEENGIVTLSFATPDFTRDAVFAFDPPATQVSLPFRVFDGLPGSSTWKRAEEAELLPLLFDLFFQGATYAREADPVSAIDFAASHGDALAGTDGKGGYSEPLIDRVERMTNGVTIYYTDPPLGVDPLLPLTVLLFSNVRFDGAQLRMSPLAYDPRVHMNLSSSKNSKDDPISRTAVFIAPFYSADDLTSWYDLPYYAGYTQTPAAVGQIEPLGGAIPEWVNELKQAGYRSIIVKDADVDVAGLVSALVPGPGMAASPGFMFMQTHGGENMVALGTKLDDKRPRASLRAELAKLNQFYPDLLAFGGATLQNPRTLRRMYMTSNRSPSTKRWYLAVTPQFWEWLRDRGADFNRSFFYLAACHSGDDAEDNQSEFPDAIRARAYFGHRGVSANVLQHAILEYFIRSLARHTRTAEEVYYNILRVQNTGEMIYEEDSLLDRRIFLAGFEQMYDANSLRGFGLVDGIVRQWNYVEAGWLGTGNINPEDLWWILFGARWNGTAVSGAQSLKYCWDEFWSNGDTGGHVAPGCNAMTPGCVPTQEEVAYASYLLAGTPVVDFNGMVPFARFTLHDGE
jgi:hypothetical protein